MARALTKARKAVLEALQGGGPASALDLGKRLASACDQATVYRALHFLEDEGWADSFVLRCEIRGTERYYVARSEEHRHWLHCESCHAFVDLGACRVEPLFREMEASLGVAIRSHTLYAAGLCQACAAGYPSEPAAPAESAHREAAPAESAPPQEAGLPPPAGTNIW